MKKTTRRKQKQHNAKVENDFPGLGPGLQVATVEKWNATRVSRMEIHMENNDRTEKRKEEAAGEEPKWTEPKWTWSASCAPIKITPQWGKESQVAAVLPSTGRRKTENHATIECTFQVGEYAVQEIPCNGKYALKWSKVSFTCRDLRRS